MLKRYLLRRLLHVIFLLASVSVLAFLLLTLAPGDFLGEAKLNPQLSASTLAALRQRYGLNKSLPQKYLYWIESTARGDLGVSFAYDLPVSVLVWPRAFKTLQLSITALAFSWFLAVPLGVWSAAARRTLPDRILSALTSTLVAIPELALACLFLLVVVRSGAFHSSSPVLPVAILVLGALPILVRHVRAALLEAANQPFASAARANGIRGRQLWFGWLLPAAANPLTSLFGLSVAGLISSSLVVEVFLGWPGLGPLFLEAIAARDLYLVIGPVMLSAVFLSLGTLLADVLLYALDPRIRIES
ncbi:MAG TPA: ABC transporter permease [Bryobacteraceae bacterium]|nr:ABC transporter permease [Bryobacteraceae bacterium]